MRILFFSFFSEMRLLLVVVGAVHCAPIFQKLRDLFTVNMDGYRHLSLSSTEGSHAERESLSTDSEGYDTENDDFADGDEVSFSSISMDESETSFESVEWEAIRLMPITNKTNYGDIIEEYFNGWDNQPALIDLNDRSIEVLERIHDARLIFQFVSERNYDCGLSDFDCLSLDVADSPRDVDRLHWMEHQEETSEKHDGVELMPVDESTTWSDIYKEYVFGWMGQQSLKNISKHGNVPKYLKERIDAGKDVEWMSTVGMDMDEYIILS